MVRKLSRDELVNRYIGRRLQAARIQRNFSIEDIAKRLRIPTQQLHAYESGDQRITIEELSIIALMFDLPVAHFFDGLEEELARLRPCATD